jgi:hypothetical protein
LELRDGEATLRFDDWRRTVLTFDRAALALPLPFGLGLAVVL